MATMGNTPRQQLHLNLERRKSYSFLAKLTHADNSLVDLTGCTLTLMVKRDEWDNDNFDHTALLVNKDAVISSPASGEGDFAFQAAELDWDPGEYYHSLILTTADGFSVVLAKGLFNLLANTESLSMQKRFHGSTATAAAELTLRGSTVVNIVASTLTRSLLSQGTIVGFGRPDRPETLEDSSLTALAAAQVGQVFVSKDGNGEDLWAWRLRWDGQWHVIEGDLPTWSEIQSKPLTFPPSAHTHAQSDVDGLTASLAGKAALVHTHEQSAVNGLVPALASKAAAVHKHDIGDLLTTNTPHGSLFLNGGNLWKTVDWTDLSNRPSVFPPAYHVHNIGDIATLATALSGKAALVHTHEQSAVNGLVPALSGKSAVGHKHPVSDLLTENEPNGPVFLSGGGYWEEVSYNDLLDKPSTFSPSAHTHAWDEITSKPSTFAPSAHTHTVADIAASGAANIDTFLGGNGRWTEAVRLDSTATASTDLNTLMGSTALYRIPSEAAGTTARNWPAAGLTGVLQSNHLDANTRQQIFFSTDGRIFQRQRVSGTWQPWVTTPATPKIVTGKANVAVNASASGTVAITFPAGHFSTAPNVQVTKATANLPKFSPCTTSVTTTGATIGVYSGDGTSATGSVSVAWMAVEG